MFVDSEDVLKHPAVLAALEKIKKDAIAQVTSAFMKAQQEKKIAATVAVANAKQSTDDDASGDGGSGKKTILLGI